MIGEDSGEGSGRMARFRRSEKEERGGGVARPPVRPEKGESPDQGLEEFVCCIREEVRALVGGHYYFIEMREEFATLCRVPHLAGERFEHECIDHLQHGISDEDLDHAIRMKVGHGFRPGYYEISDHIEMKLRALLDA
jgi:hypothetical protein